MNELARSLGVGRGLTYRRNHRSEYRPACGEPAPLSQAIDDSGAGTGGRQPTPVIAFTTLIPK
jgi:hypothetical protein